MKKIKDIFLKHPFIYTSILCFLLGMLKLFITGTQTEDWGNYVYVLFFTTLPIFIFFFYLFIFLPFKFIKDFLKSKNIKKSFSKRKPNLLAINLLKLSLIIISIFVVGYVAYRNLVYQDKKEKKTEQETYQEKNKENEIDQKTLVYSPLYSLHKRKLNESSHNLKYTFKKNKLNLNLSDTEHRELVLKFFFYDECKGGQKQIDKLTKTLEGVTIDPVAIKFANVCRVVLNNKIREKFKNINKAAKSDEEYFKEILKINFHDALDHYYWYEVEELK